MISEYLPDVGIDDIGQTRVTASRRAEDEHRKE